MVLSSMLGVWSRSYCFASTGPRRLSEIQSYPKLVSFYNVLLKKGMARTGIDWSFVRSDFRLRFIGAIHGSAPTPGFCLTSAPSTASTCCLCHHTHAVAICLPGACRARRAGWAGWAHGCCLHLNPVNNTPVSQRHGPHFSNQRIYTRTCSGCGPLRLET